MLQNRDAYLATGPQGLAVCGVYVPSNDAVHVGLFCRKDAERRILEFNGTNQIIYLDPANRRYDDFYFCPIPDFPDEYLDSIIALFRVLGKNLLSDFKLMVTTPVFNGGTFEMPDGNFIATSNAEKFINCAVFVLAILNTYDYQLVDWDSFPELRDEQKAFLLDWLTYNNVPQHLHPICYRQSKALRGRHVLISPNTPGKPAIYAHIEPLSNQLIDFLKAELASKV